MRLYTLDSLKAVAAFFVVTLHVGLFDEFSQFYAEIIRLSGRWAVPFFFMVTGYFIGIKNAESQLSHSVLKIAKVFVVSSLLYLPYYFIHHDYSVKQVGERVLSDTIIISGMSFHLWYLSSLIFGLLTFKLLHQTLSQRGLLMISIAIVLCYFTVDLLPDLTDNDNWVRHFISVPCIVFGYLVSKIDQERINLRLCGIVLLVSFVGIYLLPYALDGEGTRSVIQRQFPLFVIPFCLALLLIAVRLNVKNNALAHIGKDYSLVIYTCHPLFLALLKHQLLPSDWQPDWLIAILTFVLAVSFAIALKKVCLPAYRLLNGQ